MCVWVCDYHIYADAHKDPKRTMDPLELELLAFVTHLGAGNQTWTL